MNKTEMLAATVDVIVGYLLYECDRETLVKAASALRNLTAPPDTSAGERRLEALPKRPDNIYSQFHLDNWRDSDFAHHTEATKKTIKYLLELEAALFTHFYARDCDKQGEATKSEGGSRKQPFDPADAAGVKSGTVTFDGQTGRPNRDEIGASQTPGSSMSFAANKPIIAGQAPGPSDRTADVTVEDIALVLLDGLKAGKAPIQIARTLLDAYRMWKQ